MLRPTVSRPVCLGVKPHLGPKTRFLLVSGNCWFVDVGRPLWREDGSVVYNCSWPSPTQSFSGPILAGLMTIFYCLEGQVPVVIPPGTGFPFHRLLRLAGLRWRYWNPPPHGGWSLHFIYIIFIVGVRTSQKTQLGLNYRDQSGRCCVGKFCGSHNRIGKVDDGHTRTCSNQPNFSFFLMGQTRRRI
jgi:hypothetical protein